MTPSGLNANASASLFNPPITECAGARWVQLDRTATDQKSERDFAERRENDNSNCQTQSAPSAPTSACPSLALALTAGESEGSTPHDDEDVLQAEHCSPGLLPPLRSRVALVRTEQLGRAGTPNLFALFKPGEFQNQRDFEAFYRNRNALSGDAAGARWIPLSSVPTR